MAEPDREGLPEYDEEYRQGSDAPPPPTYDEAVSQRLFRSRSPDDGASVSASAAQVPSRHSLLADDYKDSRVYPLMIRLKEVINMFERELGRIERDVGGNVLKDGGHFKDSVELSEIRNERFTKFFAELLKDLKAPTRWVREQERHDIDWDEEPQPKAKVPSLTVKELRSMKSAMMKIENKIANHEIGGRQWAATKTTKATELEYEAVASTKMLLERMWRLLTRIAKDEIKSDDDDDDEETGVGATGVGATASSPFAEGQRVKDFPDKRDVPEDDVERLRQKRIQYYNNGRRSTGGDPDEAEEEAEEMLPREEDVPTASAPAIDEEEEDDGGLLASVLAAAESADSDADVHPDEDEEANSPQATGGSAVVPDAEDQRGWLGREDSRRGKRNDIGQEIEMGPMGKIVSEDDIDIDTKWIGSLQSRSSYDLAIDPSVHLGVHGYSPRASTIGESETGAGPVQQFEIDDGPDSELGRRDEQRRRRSDYDVGFIAVPFVREIINSVVKRWRMVKYKWPVWSITKRLVLVFSVLFVIGLVLMVSLLPASFVYVDYHQMGFVHNKATGVTDLGHVYQFGCYLLAPQHSLVLFPATAHFLDLSLSVMNKAGLTIGLDVSLQYLIRPSELHHLYRRYDREYETTIHNMAESTIKNTAIEFTMEEYRLNRSMVEAMLFKKLKHVLSGDCCNADNDRYKRLASRAHVNDTVACNTNTSMCNQGFHIDVAFFQMGQVTIPVMDYYLKQMTLQLETEKELYIQEKAVQEKLTSLSVQKITNEAKEIREKAKASSLKIKRIADASSLVIKEMSYIQSLRKTYQSLNMTEEQDKTSLLYLNTLKNYKDNLVAFSYNYQKESVASP